MRPQRRKTSKVIPKTASTFCPEALSRQKHRMKKLKQSILAEVRGQRLEFEEAKVTAI